MDSFPSLPTDAQLLQGLAVLVFATVYLLTVAFDTEPLTLERIARHWGVSVASALVIFAIAASYVERGNGAPR